ncbi:MAG: ATP-binding protein [Pyrinomonadaceae bacterium]
MYSITTPEFRVDVASFRSNPPNPQRTLSALRELGYDSYSAIADLIDNSIDAGAENIAVSIADRAGDIVVEIADDGSGMDESRLDEALRLGSETSRVENDLGKFGMGLVTASISMSKRVEVFTRTNGGDGFYGGFDLEIIEESNEFVKWVQPIRDQGNGKLFDDWSTMIRLSKTDRINNRRPTEFANVLRKRLGQIFRKFLKAGTLISVNGRTVDAIDPLMLADKDTTIVYDEPVQIEGGTIHLRVVDLPDYGQSGNKDLGIIPQNSGFYILRNNREIMESETFDFYKKHPDYSHFRAEIEFDGSLDALLHSDVKKMTITPPKSVLDKISSITSGMWQESGRKGRKRANANRGAIDHSLAEGNIKRRSQLIPKPKTLIETRERKGSKGTHTSKDGKKPRNPHVSDLKTPAGLRVEFNEADYGEGPFYNVRQEGKTVFVTYNREHPFWREIVEHANEPKVVATLDYLVFGLANAELLVPEQAAIVKANVNSTLVGLLV